MKEQGMPERPAMEQQRKQRPGCNRKRDGHRKYGCSQLGKEGFPRPGDKEKKGGRRSKAKDREHCLSGNPRQYLLGKYYPAVASF